MGPGNLGRIEIDLMSAIETPDPEAQASAEYRSGLMVKRWRPLPDRLPSLAGLPPLNAQPVGPGITTRSRGRCAGKGARTGFLRVNGSTAREVLVAGNNEWHSYSLLPTAMISEHLRYELDRRG